MIRMQLIGHLGRDVVKREVNGAVVFSFPVAVNERFKNAQGVLEERTTWVDCSLWDRGNVAPYLTQGTMVFLDGVPKVEAFISKAGVLTGAIKFRVFSIQLLSSRDEERRKVILSEVPVPETEPSVEQPADDLPF
ncbi:single-stranded DNA-binding protein [Chitinophaga silvatica]|uniref:Single-stranded DNA-binding protein n=1 Tax=Chitinophaga silvatica TaxID=2282649 RepID=A0A3E1YEC9_9BACT|nr:single-stranded DNA-binding protein [Chitinophaga silvatica]RFS24861.1 single-stranded DNA-binding protein [Chitinophaga silvatica]